jgi:hypothetical protein
MGQEQITATGNDSITVSFVLGQKKLNLANLNVENFFIAAATIRQRGQGIRRGSGKNVATGGVKHALEHSTRTLLTFPLRGREVGLSKLLSLASKDGPVGVEGTFGPSPRCSSCTPDQ